VLIEAVFVVDEASANALADALLDAGALSVAVEDADADTPDEQPIFGEPGMQQEAQAWRRSRLVMLLQTDSDQDFFARAGRSDAGRARDRARSALARDHPPGR